MEHPKLDQVERDSALLGGPTPSHSRKKLQKRPPPQFPRSILSVKSLEGGGELLGEAH